MLDAGRQAGRLASWQVTASGLPRTFDTLPYKLASWNAELSWLSNKRATNQPTCLCGGWECQAQGSLEACAALRYCLGLCLHQGGSQHGVEQRGPEKAVKEVQVLLALSPIFGNLGHCVLQLRDSRIQFSQAGFSLSSTGIGPYAWLE